MGNNFSHLAIVVNENHSFFAEFPDMTTAYKLPRVKTDEAIHRWRSDPLTFYQNQFNFAVYCTATSCGIGWDLLNDKNLYIVSLFNFHLYFTTIPGDDVFDALNNRYDNAGLSNNNGIPRPTD